MNRIAMFILIFVVFLVPAWWLNGWIARRAAARFDHYASDATPMTVGEIDRFWPPLNDSEWTTLPPEVAEKTTRFGFTRWTISHTSGADLIIWAYEAGFPFRSFVGEVRSDPNRGSHEFNLGRVPSALTGSNEEQVLPTGRIWSGTIGNVLSYAAAAWIVICGPFVLLARRRAAPAD